LVGYLAISVRHEPQCIRLGRDGVFVSVHPNAGYGWHATVVTAPARTLRSRRRVEEIAAQMRAEGYKLR
jgi:hypothetical protein